MENTSNSQVVRTREWIITILITAIPLVGFIMLFVWGFGGNTNQNKANWAKATLLWIAIGISFYILFALFFGVAMLSNLGNS